MKISMKKRFWFQGLPEHSKLCLYSCLLLLPGMIALIFFELLHIRYNIILVYLVVDGVIWLISTGYAGHLLKREKEERSFQMSRDGFRHLKRKVCELKDIEK